MALKLLHRGGVFILLCSDGKNMTEIRKATGITNSHVCKIIRCFEDRGIVTLTKKKNQKEVNLTKDGKKIRKGLCNILGGIADGYR